jgi:hypothetical protein
MKTAAYTPRLQKKYHDEVIPALQKKFNYKKLNANAEARQDLYQQGSEWCGG